MPKYAGEIVITNNGVAVDKRRLEPDKLVELDDLSYGVSVQAIIGLDIIWEIKFNKQHTLMENNEAEILRQIKGAAGTPIPAPHSLKNIQIGLRHYPQISLWIRKCIREGTINEQSFRKLQHFYLTTKKEGDKT